MSVDNVDVPEVSLDEREAWQPIPLPPQNLVESIRHRGNGRGSFAVLVYNLYRSLRFHDVELQDYGIGVERMIENADAYEPGVERKPGWKAFVRFMRVMFDSQRKDTDRETAYLSALKLFGQM